MIACYVNVYSCDEYVNGECYEWMVYFVLSWALVDTACVPFFTFGYDLRVVVINTACESFLFVYGLRTVLFLFHLIPLMKTARFEEADPDEKPAEELVSRFRFFGLMIVTMFFAFTFIVNECMFYETKRYCMLSRKRFKSHKIVSLKMPSTTQNLSRHRSSKRTPCRRWCALDYLCEASVGIIVMSDIWVMVWLNKGSSDSPSPRH